MVLTKNGNKTNGKVKDNDMDKELYLVIARLMKEAKHVLAEEGLDKEKEVVNLIKTTSFLAWNNTAPEDECDYTFVTGMIADWECSMVDKITELHHQRIKEELNIG